MKTIRKITLLLFALFSLTLAQNGYADTNPPDPPGEHGQTDDQDAGGGAPLGGGLFILLGLGAAYGGKRLYDFRAQQAPEEE